LLHVDLIKFLVVLNFAVRMFHLYDFEHLPSDYSLYWKVFHAPLLTYQSCGVLCTDTSAPSQPVFVNSAASDLLVNRRLVLKQLPSGQFALTVQSVQPAVLSGAFVITNSHAVDTSAGSLTIGSSCEPNVSDSHVCLIIWLMVMISFARKALLVLHTYDLCGLFGPVILLHSLLLITR